MLKRLLCLVIISSLLYSDIVYPLSRSSFLQDRKFLGKVSALAKGRTKSLSFGDIDEKRDIHGVFEKADREGRLFTEDNPGRSDEIYGLWNDIITDGRFGAMYGLYQKRAGERSYREYFLDRIPANIRIIKGKDLFSFEHGDHLDLPDAIGLNLDLFRGGYSPQTQVFLLRHCADRIRYDRYKTIINDIKYLTKMPRDERRKILRELGGEEYGRFLMYIVQFPLKEAKIIIRKQVGLRFKTYTSPDGANIWYSAGGNPNAKRTLVFLHGIGINSRDWRHQITFFEKDYRIIAVDLRGFGKSQGLGKWPPHIKNYADDLEGILTAEGITDAILVGHSLGGIAALNLDELYEDTPLEKRRIKGLVLIASTAGDPSESFIFSGVKGITFRQFLTFFLFYLSQFEFIWNNPMFKHFVKSPLIRPFVRMIFERFIIQRETHPVFTNHVIGSVFMNDLQDLICGFRAILTHDVSERLKDLGIPVLWVIGRGDWMIRTKFQEEYARRIRDCSVVRLPRASHYPHARYPRRVNKEIYGFINKGEFRFLQLINEEFKLEISTDKLEGSELRLRERLRDVREVDLMLIDHISRAVTAYGKLTGVSDGLMVKAVMATVEEILPRQGPEIPSAGPQPVEDTVEYIRRSV